MAKEVTVNRFSAIDDGATDWEKIRTNFSNIEEVLNEHASELKALARHSTFTISEMFQTAGKHVLMNPGKHLRCRILNAHASVHDNVEEEVHVNIVGFSQDIKFSESEKKGSAKIFDLHPGKVVHFSDIVEIELSGNRRVGVHITFESIEEG